MASGETDEGQRTRRHTVVLAIVDSHPPPGIEVGRLWPRSRLDACARERARELDQWVVLQRKAVCDQHDLRRLAGSSPGTVRQCKARQLVHAQQRIEGPEASPLQPAG